MEFVEGVKADAEPVEEVVAEGSEKVYLSPVDPTSPVFMVYCGICTLPVEYCEYGSCYDKCKEWRESNMDDTELARLMDAAELQEEEEEEGAEGGKKKKKKKVVAAPKTKAALSLDDCCVKIARIQRQKRKYVTAIAGLESVPDLKIKDVAKAIGKRFASGSSVSDTAGGSKEIVIQGDVCFDIPEFLTKTFNVPANKMFYLQDGSLVPV